jgi:hypothetical protein
MDNANMERNNNEKTTITHKIAGEGKYDKAQYCKLPTNSPGKT